VSLQEQFIYDYAFCAINSYGLKAVAIKKTRISN